jgi:hypothetical protein
VADTNPLDQLLIDDHNGGYWTTRADWDRFVAEATGEITFRVLRVVQPTFMDNQPAVGAPKNWRWGYLSCGCRNDGFGNHEGYQR